jgi:hypothetical protein
LTDATSGTRDYGHPAFVRYDLAIWRTIHRDPFLRAAAFVLRLSIYDAERWR